MQDCHRIEADGAAVVHATADSLNEGLSIEHVEAVDTVHIFGVLETPGDPEANREIRLGHKVALSQADKAHLIELGDTPTNLDTMMPSSLRRGLCIPSSRPSEPSLSSS